jgi:hypothetical protein
MTLLTDGYDGPSVLYFIKDESPCRESYPTFHAALDDALYFGYKVGEFMPTRITKPDGELLVDSFELRKIYKECR